MWRYGSPHEGRKGLVRYRQCAGRRREPSPTPNVKPSKTLAASISRASIPIVELELFCHRCRRLDRALQRGRNHGHDVAFGDRGRSPFGHRLAGFGQVESRQAAVENVVRVVHLAMSQQMDDSALAHAPASAREPAAARAACGNASAIRSIAASSWAAETNQASKADGGAYTPRSSNAWKKAA